MLPRVGLASTILAEWLKWAPENEKGSTKVATAEELSDALTKAGLAAQSVMTCVLQHTCT